MEKQKVEAAAAAATAACTAAAAHGSGSGIERAFTRTDRTRYHTNILIITIIIVKCFDVTSANTPEVLMFLVRGRNSLPKHNPEAETACACMPNETQSISSIGHAPASATIADANSATTL